jgi:hypothetical protein
MTNAELPSGKRRLPDFWRLARANAQVLGNRGHRGEIASREIAILAAMQNR